MATTIKKKDGRKLENGHENILMDKLQQVATYRSVDGLPALKVAILADTVMRLAKGDARKAVGNEAGINGVEAVEEAGVPALRGLRRLGVDDLTRARQDVVEAVLPVVEVLLIDGAVVVARPSLRGNGSGSLLLNGNLGGVVDGSDGVLSIGIHCVNVVVYKKKVSWGITRNEKGPDVKSNGANERKEIGSVSGTRSHKMGWTGEKKSHGRYLYITSLDHISSKRRGGSARLPGSPPTHCITLAQTRRLH